MASKSVYQKFNSTALKHFGLESTPQYGVLTGSGVETVLLTDSNDTYSNIKSILSTATLNATTFKAKKKGFLLPGSPISIDRVKAACKENKIVLTNDYESADFIISHDNFSDSFSHGERIKSQAIMAKLWNYDSHCSSNNRIPEIETYYEETGNLALYDSKWEDKVSYFNIQERQNVYECWLLTGLAINIAYKLENKELDSIDVDAVIYESKAKQILNEEMLELLTNQITNHVRDDINLAGMIMPNIDYNNKLHLLWQLSQNIGTYMSEFNRSKDIQHWLNVSNFEKIKKFSAESMILYLDKNKLLDEENFRYLESIVRQNIIIYNRDLYIFKVEVKPEYRKYLKGIKEND